MAPPGGGYLHGRWCSRVWFMVKLSAVQIPHLSKIDCSKALAAEVPGGATGDEAPNKWGIIRRLLTKQYWL